MHKLILWLGALILATPLFAAEMNFDFSEMPTNQPPTNCFSLVGGQGKPGVWRVLRDEVPLLFPPTDSRAPATAPANVVGQLAWDATDEHFPMLQLGTNTYGDFTFTTRFKIVDGFSEQMAGIAFRMQDERNYYYVRASALGNTFYFFRVFKGERSPPIGNQVHFDKGVWYDLSIQCSGDKIRIMINGQKALPELTDPTFAAGKIAYWTKSDSIAYFADTRVKYTPHEAFAAQMVRDVMADFPHLLGLQVLVVPPKSKQSKVIASSKSAEIGQTGESTDVDCVQKGLNYYRVDGPEVFVTMPLRDRNGEPLGAVRIIMKKGPFQSQQSALSRATPVLDEMEQRAATVDSLN
jgi:hypothetical protein